MSVALNNPITQADMDALALIANTNLLPLVNAAITASEWGGTWTYGDDGAGNPLLVVFGGNNVFDRPEAMNIGDNAILNPQPDYIFDLAVKNWRDEFNRMRGDYYWMLKNSVTGAESIFENPAAIVSGPWIVDVNDPVTFPRFSDFIVIPNDYPLAGIFSGSVSGQPCWFTGLKFYYAHADAPVGISIDTVRHADLFMPRDGTNPGGGIIYNGLINNSLTITYDCGSPGQFKAVLKFPFNGTSLPAASVFSPMATPATGVTFSTEVNTLIGYSGDFNLVVTIDVALTGSGTIVLSTGAASGYTEVQGNYYSRGNLIFSTSSAVADSQGIHPSSTVKMMTPDAQPTGDFILNGSGTIAAWILSSVNLHGVWNAKTLPVPGINLFLDQDMPPFVSRFQQSESVPTYTVAVGDGNNVSGSTVISSSMRVPTTGGEDVSRFGALKSSLASRPTPYQVFRDTDFIPWNYGYPTGLSTGVNVFRAQTAAAAGTLNQYSLAVPADATQVKIRLRRRGAALGWKFAAGVGTFQYGDPLAGALTILVRKADRPTLTDYDFFVTSNDLTIDPDGGGSYLATVLNDGFFYAVYTPGGVSVEYDLIEFIETVPAPSLTIPPPKQYFPVARECFSYCLLDVPSVLIASAAIAGEQRLRFGKPIPQSGYCIFKLRATRLPQLNAAGISVTPATGPADIVVTIGQNILQPDNTLIFTPLLEDDGITPYTVTIPAAERDSGDVAVFWPVLAGNELVYQCAEQVVLEAWSNWQPIFFNQALGYFINDGVTTLTPPEPTQFTTALGFMNFFVVQAAGYPQLTAERPPPWDQNRAQVQYPISIEIYNDLEAVLNLI